MKKKLQKQSLVEMLRSTVEGWRCSGRPMSREAVAVSVIEAHDAIGAEALTGIGFESAGKDCHSRAKTAAQKLYRWLGGDDEPVAKLPADMLPSILEALPMEQRLDFLNQVLCQLGVEARAIGRDAVGNLDVTRHLCTVMKEGNEAQLALATLSPNASPTEMLTTANELRESALAHEEAASDLMAEALARQALERAVSSSSK